MTLVTPGEPEDAVEKDRFEHRPPVTTAEVHRPRRKASTDSAYAAVARERSRAESTEMKETSSPGRGTSAGTGHWGTDGKEANPGRWKDRGRQECNVAMKENLLL